MKVKGKGPLEINSLEEAMIAALKAAKNNFSQSDFLARCQEDIDAGNFPEYGWAPPEDVDCERREFESSLEIFRRGPDVYYAPFYEHKHKSHKK